MFTRLWTDFYQMKKPAARNGIQTCQICIHVMPISHSSEVEPVGKQQHLFAAPWDVQHRAGQPERQRCAEWATRLRGSWHYTAELSEELPQHGLACEHASLT